MAEHGAQYDHIGSKYDEYARTATLKRAESYTFFRMVGALEGKRVLDLACGFGFYTRLLKQRGAAQVIGVDISPEMIRLAHQQEQAEPLGITYQVGDAVTLPPLGPFDLVTAVYLLNYATSKDQLLGMCRSVYDNLVAGGRFIAYTDQPGVHPQQAELHEVWGHRAAPGARGGPVRLRRRVCHRSAHALSGTPSGARPRMSGRSQEAGFRDFAWYPSEVAPEDIARYGEAYWRDFHDNCLVIGLVCQK